MVLSSYKVIARVCLVHRMDVEQRQAAADHQTKPNDFGYESASSHLLSMKAVAYLLSHGCWKAESTQAL